MKCRQIALLLPLVLLGPGTLSACVLSPYDRYYVHAAAQGTAHPDLPIGAILDRCIPGYLSQLTGSGERAAGYAWQCCKDAVALVCPREKSREQPSPARRDKSDRLVKNSRAAAAAAARQPVEWLCVTSCTYPSWPTLVTPDRATGECWRGHAANAVLLADFCRIDDESCLAFSSGADLLARNGHGGRNVERASAVSLWAVRLEPWARFWLGAWDVVFRNISQQIARLDWTTLLTDKSRGLAAHKATPVSNSAER